MHELFKYWNNGLSSEVMNKWNNIEEKIFFYMYTLVGWNLEIIPYVSNKFILYFVQWN